MLSGDIESNPGPSSQSTSISSASSISDPLLDEFDECITQFTSFMHLNVQSLVPKIDLLNVELQKFDILVAYKRSLFLADLNFNPDTFYSKDLQVITMDHMIIVFHIKCCSSL
jgi:hypothetical protein